MLVTGANTLRRYEAGRETPTARYNRLDGSYYDIFNTAVESTPQDVSASTTRDGW